MSTRPTTPVAVPRQEWTTVSVPELGTWSPTLTVTVVLPAKDCQGELDLTLAALAAQTYPAELMDVIVVDDDSAEPLRLPAVHPSAPACSAAAGDGHGSGRARHAGAEAATSDVVLFLDADIVATRTHVEAHPLAPHRRRRRRARAQDVRRRRRRQRGRRAAATATTPSTSLFDGPQAEAARLAGGLHPRGGGGSPRTPTTPSSPSSGPAYRRRARRTPSGGFSTFGLRGIVDTEFGYRIFTAGGVLIRSRRRAAYHQGARNFATRGDEIKRERSGLAANHLPIRCSARPNVGPHVAGAGGERRRRRHQRDRRRRCWSPSTACWPSAYTDLMVTVSPRARSCAALGPGLLRRADA